MGSDIMAGGAALGSLGLCLAAGGGISCWNR